MSRMTRTGDVPVVGLLMAETADRVGDAWGARHLAICDVRDTLVTNVVVVRRLGGGGGGGGRAR